MIVNGITYFSEDDLKKSFNIDTEISVSLIKEACKMLNVKFSGAATLFLDPVDKLENETELTQMCRKLLPQTFRAKNQIILYKKLNKPHTHLIYYRVISFNGSNIEDVKRILKVHKLKAFL